ncbi:MAG: LysR family transcriptional regulator [Alphaproteobacteria bacterium]|nr:LysR family transcriptional regulator [Alphaproteobacteria bacterium]MBU1514684.1 LysR family transcriptional regulator [Alphaproteobacteria bacterium]MBU2093543.1 LysR family transcriptional regulator [Alphaproteobacteria bacterium]MBU2149457.1 LysR family transcriptional regulator [Alphaproteobacteria bacterium]MBU2305500.1 LysR family transcriptional regulator [Alphaproteobacteria bacterium]
MSTPDLNLLRIFDVLLEERSVTKAGVRLGLSQSAVSHALNRLRHMLNDELFVRGPSGMRPTPRALEIATRVHGPLAQLQAALTRTEFDPATSQRRFTLVAGAYGAAVLAPPLVRRLAELAPQAELVVSGYGGGVLDMLDDRSADLAVAGVMSAPERFGFEPLVTEDLAWAVSATAPLAKRETLDLAALAATLHIGIARQPQMDEMATRGFVTRASWEDFGALEQALSEAGLVRRIAVTVPDTSTALAVASRSDMATLVPRRLAGAWAEAGLLKLFPPPYPSPPVNIRLLFLKDRLREAPIAWLRGLIQDVVREV